MLKRSRNLGLEIHRLEKELVAARKAEAERGEEVSQLLAQNIALEQRIEELLKEVQTQTTNAVIGFYQSLVDIGVAKKKLEQVRIWLQDRYEDIKL